MALNPYAVGSIILGGVYLGFLFGGLFRAPESSPLGPLVRQLVISLFFFGYPLSVGTAIGRLSNLPRSRAGVVALIGFFWVLVAQIAGTAFLAHPSIAVRLLVFVCILPGALAPIYILWFGANRLAAAELRRSVRLDHYLGALLLFAFLPIGSFFLQRRLNRLLPYLEAEGIAGEAAPES